MANFSLDDDKQPPPNSGAPELPDAEQHAAEIAAQSPDVQQHAIDEAERQRKEADAQIPVDSKGTKFDAAKHTGTKLKSGEWRMKRGASTLAAPRTKKTEAITGTVLSADQIAQSRAAGAAAAAMMFSSCTMLFGDEWQPRSEKECGFDEKNLMGQAFGDYFVAKGVTDFPPGVTLAFMTLGYITARFSMPKTRSKLSRFKSWLALRIAKRKLIKEFKKRGIIANVEIKDGVLLVDGKADWKGK